MPGELDFLHWIRAQSTARHDVVIPQGDDLAALAWRDVRDLLIVGADQVLDGVHFDSKIHSPRDIGKKAMNRNLSDCAAMAAEPVAAVVTAALPKGSSIEYAKEIYLGLKEAADAFDTAIVGGDTGSWTGRLAISVTILGRATTPIRRSGAKIGDGVWVTGALGGSMLHHRHLTFTPRVVEGLKLRDSGRVTAMIDVSDGLVRDLTTLCRESSVAANLFVDQIPIHADARDASDGRSPLEHALHDGEDYELLFTADGAGLFDFATRIGTIEAGSGVTLVHPDGRREIATPGGWEHAW